MVEKLQLKIQSAVQSVLSQGAPGIQKSLSEMKPEVISFMNKILQESHHKSNNSAELKALNKKMSQLVNRKVNLDMKDKRSNSPSPV